MSMLLHGFTNVFTTEKHEPALQSTAQASVGAGNIGQGGVFPQIERMWNNCIAYSGVGKRAGENDVALRRYS